MCHICALNVPLTGNVSDLRVNERKCVIFAQTTGSQGSLGSWDHVFSHNNIRNTKIEIEIPFNLNHLSYLN